MFEFSTKATMLLLSILITLAVVEGGDEQPFTAFSHAAMQFSRANDPDPAPIIKRQTFEFRKTEPVAEKLNQLLNQQFQQQIPLEFRRTQLVRQGRKRIQPNGGQHQYQGPFNSFGTSFSAFFRASGDIVEQTRTQAD